MRHGLTVVLLSGGSVAGGRGDVVPVHVVALRHVVWSWRLAVAATEWFRFRRRNWFVDAGLGWRQRLVVRIPAMIRSDEDLVTVAAAVKIKLFPNLHDL